MTMYISPSMSCAGTKRTVSLLNLLINLTGVKIMRFNPTTIILVLILTGVSLLQAQDNEIRKFLSQAGIQPQGNIRGQVDTIGFVTTAVQMDEVLKQEREHAAERKIFLSKKYGWDETTVFKAGICPHDDYFYAGRLYELLIPEIKAKTVILFGVFHKARYFACEDVLVFDSYEQWRGPYGPVKVSPLREEIIAKLTPGNYIADNDMQMVEHSLEAIVPWLQAYNPEVEIVPVLIPYMDWPRMEILADELSSVLAGLMKDKGWKLGEDAAIICSADAVHYGDDGWGGSNYADFGTGVPGYQKAVRRDIELAEGNLCGVLTAGKLRDFLYTCVDENDVKQYKITWCGRFSIPFGLNVADRLSRSLDGQELTGYFLDYGTSASEASLNVEGLGGLGATAPSNLHHWVGYAAVGYR